MSVFRSGEEWAEYLDRRDVCQRPDFFSPLLLSSPSAQPTASARLAQLVPSNGADRQLEQSRTTARPWRSACASRDLALSAKFVNAIESDWAIRECACYFKGDRHRPAICAHLDRLNAGPAARAGVDDAVGERVTPREIAAHRPASRGPLALRLNAPPNSWHQDLQRDGKIVQNEASVRCAADRGARNTTSAGVRISSSAARPRAQEVVRLVCVVPVVQRDGTNSEQGCSSESCAGPAKRERRSPSFRTPRSASSIEWIQVLTSPSRWRAWLHSVPAWRVF
jgi:hypothetical protein